MTPPIPDGRCPHCDAPIVDLFAEWTDEYESQEGKQRILAGDVVFDCYFCQQPIQLCLPLDLMAPAKKIGDYRIAKRSRRKCDEWLQGQHPDQTLSQFVENADLQYQGRWAFDGYNWKEGETHRHAAANRS